VLIFGAVVVTMGPSLATHPAAGQTLAAHTPRHALYLGAPAAVAAAHDELARLAAFGQPIYCGAGTKPLVALTFDDGPGILTPRALKHLRRRKASATFFLVGRLLTEPSFAAIAAFEARQGMAFGNHTWDHVTMSHGSPRRYAREITATSSAIQRATGQWPRLFRPPYGVHSHRLDSWLRAHGMLEILWSTDSLDSQGATTRKVIKTVLRGIRPGAIIGMHDNRGTTETALPRILAAIHRRGLKAVTVQQLLSQDPPTEAQLRAHTCP
jgi:peptidoglycan/xylan/chitin deacetylase (PgdA/CDA1 family)